MLLRGLASVLVLSYSWIIYCPSANAWTIYPLKVSKEMNPGTATTFLVLADGVGETQMKRFEGMLHDVGLDEDGDLKFTAAGTSKYSVAKYVTYAPIQFTLAPGERKDLRITVKLPANIEPGEYLASLRVLEKTIQKQTAGTARRMSVNIAVAFATTIAIIVPPTETKSLEILSVNFTPKDKQAPAYIAASLKNPAVVRSTPRISYQILDASGKSVHSEDAVEYKILRDSSRTFKFAVPPNLSAGTYKLIAKIEQGKKLKTLELEKSFVL